MFSLEWSVCESFCHVDFEKRSGMREVEAVEVTILCIANMYGSPHTALSLALSKPVFQTPILNSDVVVSAYFIASKA